MKNYKKHLFFSALTVLLCLPVSIFAEEFNITLEQAVALVKEKNPLIAISTLNLADAIAQKDKVTGSFVSPSVEVTGYTGFVPEARGDVTEEIDSDGELGPFYKADFTAVLPLYTFGKHKFAKNAWAHNLAAITEEESQTKERLVRDTINAYAALDGTHRLRVLSEELMTHYTELVEEMEKEYQSDSSELSISELLELKTYAYDISKNKSEASLSEHKASLYLNGLVDNLDGMPFSVMELVPPSFELSEQSITEKIQTYGQTSPELKKLNAQVGALNSFSQLTAKKTLPNIFLAIGGGIAHAGNRDKQSNPFVAENFNYNRIGATLGLKWSFNYHSNRYEKFHAKKQYKTLKQKYILKSLELNGKLQYARVKALKHWELYLVIEESLKTAKKWLRLEVDNWDVGLGDARQLIKTYKSFYSLSAEHAKVTSAYFSALSELAYISGNTHILLDWIKDGKVIFI